MSIQKIVISFDEYKNLKTIEKKYYELLESKCFIVYFIMWLLLNITKQQNK